MKSRCYSSFLPLRELQDNNLIPAVFYTYKFILPTYTYLYYHDIILRLIITTITIVLRLLI